MPVANWDCAFQNHWICHFILQSASLGPMCISSRSTICLLLLPVKESAQVKYVDSGQIWIKSVSFEMARFFPHVIYRFCFTLQRNIKLIFLRHYITQKAAFLQKFCSDNLQDVFLSSKKLTICVCQDKTFSSTCPCDNQHIYGWYGRSTLNVLSSYWSIWQNCRYLIAFARM